MREWTPEFISDIQHKMENHPVEVETIIAGIDAFGAHIFTITSRGEMLCGDAVSFACIGTGASHAESILMNARYQRQVPWQEAITLTSIAKKRSEISPTVGPASDFFFIGRDGFNVFSQEIHDYLDIMYKKFDEKQRKSTKEAVDKTREYLAEVMKTHQAKQAQTPPAPTTATQGADDPLNGAPQPQRGVNLTSPSDAPDLGSKSTSGGSS
jgi:hypothetical protein